MRLNLVSHKESGHNKKKIHREALKCTFTDKLPNLHNGFFLTAELPRTHDYIILI